MTPHQCSHQHSNSNLDRQLQQSNPAGEDVTDTDTDTDAADVLTTSCHCQDECVNQCMICLDEIEMNVDGDKRQEKQTHENDGDDENDDIDNEIMSKYDVLPCGHTFHRKCLNEWRFAHETCPTCRYRLEYYEMFC